MFGKQQQLADINTTRNFEPPSSSKWVVVGQDFMKVMCHALHTFPWEHIQITIVRHIEKYCFKLEKNDGMHGNAATSCVQHRKFAH